MYITSISIIICKYYIYDYITDDWTDPVSESRPIHVENLRNLYTHLWGIFFVIATEIFDQYNSPSSHMNCNIAMTKAITDLLFCVSEMWKYNKG